MYAIKLILAIAAICSALCAVLLLWNESKVTCGYTTVKVCETLFIATSLLLTREEAKL